MKTPALSVSSPAAPGRPPLAAALATCPASLATATLDGAEYAWRSGRVTDAEFRAYLAAWNATPGRFTQAFIRNARKLVQLDPETLTPAARELFAAEAAACGAVLN